MRSDRVQRRKTTRKNKKLTNRSKRTRVKRSKKSKKYKVSKKRRTFIKKSRTNKKASRRNRRMRGAGTGRRLNRKEQREQQERQDVAFNDQQNAEFRARHDAAFKKLFPDLAESGTYPFIKGWPMPGEAGAAAMKQWQARLQELAEEADKAAEERYQAALTAGTITLGDPYPVSLWETFKGRFHNR